jgi:hypothetical protein
MIRITKHRKRKTREERVCRRKEDTIDPHATHHSVNKHGVPELDALRNGKDAVVSENHQSEMVSLQEYPATNEAM